MTEPVEPGLHDFRHVVTCDYVNGDGMRRESCSCQERSRKEEATPMKKVSVVKFESINLGI